METEAVADRAEALFREGYHCSEAVLLAVGESLLPDFDRRLVRMATPWGGGIGYGGSVCGSLAGAVMAIGLLFGRDSLDQRPNEAIRKARALRQAFEARFGSLLCRDITGGRFHRAGDRCAETVRFAVEMALDLCEASPRGGGAES